MVDFDTSYTYQAPSEPSSASSSYRDTNNSLVPVQSLELVNPTASIPYVQMVDNDFSRSRFDRETYNQRLSDHLRSMSPVENGRRSGTASPPIRFSTNQAVRLQDLAVRLQRTVNERNYTGAASSSRSHEAKFDEEGSLDDIDGDEPDYEADYQRDECRARRSALVDRVAKDVDRLARGIVDPNGDRVSRQQRIESRVGR